jgi:hypothetical protein
MSLYDGRTLLGRIREADGTLNAFTPGGDLAGVFSSLKDASAALAASLATAEKGTANER